MTSKSELKRLAEQTIGHPKHCNAYKPCAFASALERRGEEDRGRRDQQITQLEAVLRELLRLYDWRFELAAREQKDKQETGYLRPETKLDLRIYGRGKKAAWEIARKLLGSGGGGSAHSATGEAQQAQAGGDHGGMPL